MKAKAEFSFYDKVYIVARQVPKGRVTSYGAIAKYIGSGRSARMVGWAMNNCGTVLPPLPAHRVLNKQGLLTGKHHFPGMGLMQELLENEGIEIEDDKVVNFVAVYWDPNIELKPFKA